MLGDVVRVARLTLSRADQRAFQLLEIVRVIGPAQWQQRVSTLRHVALPNVHRQPTGRTKQVRITLGQPPVAAEMLDFPGHRSTVIALQ